MKAGVDPDEDWPDGAGAGFGVVGTRLLTVLPGEAATAATAAEPLAGAGAGAATAPADGDFADAGGVGLAVAGLGAVGGAGMLAAGAEAPCAAGVGNDIADVGREALTPAPAINNPTIRTGNSFDDRAGRKPRPALWDFGVGIVLIFVFSYE